MAPKIKRVLLTPTPLTLLVGETRRVTAIAQDAAQRRVTGVAIAFGTTDPDVVSLVRVGTGVVEVTALAAGTARLDATCGGVTGTAPLTVVAPDPVPVPAPVPAPVPVETPAPVEPAPIPDPVIVVGPATYVVRPGAPAGGDGSEGAPFGTLAALDAGAGARIAGARIVLRGGALAVGESLVLRGGPGPDAPTIYEVPSGETLTIYGGTDPNGPPAIYGNGARWVARRGVIRLRPDPAVPHSIRRFLLVRCADVDLGVIDVAGTYTPGDATGAGSMGDNSLYACERVTLPRGGTVDVVGSTPESAGNGGDCLFIARGCRDITVTGWTFKRAGHVGTTVIGGEMLDGAFGPATERVKLIDCTWENEWTGACNINGATRGVLIENATVRGAGRLKRNALSREGFLLTGDGTELRGALLEDIAAVGIQVQAYPFGSLLQHARGIRISDVRGRGIDGPALVMRVRGANNDPTPAAPDFWCELRDVIAEGLDLIDVCRGGSEDHGVYGGVAYPMVLDYGWSSDQEWAAALASSFARAGVVRNSRFSVAAGRPMGALALIAKQGTPSRYLATPADVAAALPGWTGLVVEPAAAVQSA